MCGKPPTRFANPDGGSDPIALELTDGLMHPHNASVIQFGAIHNASVIQFGAD